MTPSIEGYTPKYAKAAACLSKDRDMLLAFHDFPAEYWKPLQDDNPQLKATPHDAIKGCLSNRMALAMVFKLLEEKSASSRRP